MYAELGGLEKDVVIATVFQLFAIYGIQMAYQQPTCRQRHVNKFVCFQQFTSEVP